LRNNLSIEHDRIFSRPAIRNAARQFAAWLADLFSSAVRRGALPLGATMLNVSAERGAQAALVENSKRVKVTHGFAIHTHASIGPSCHR
jgi:hypothetical protein